MMSVWKDFVLGALHIRDNNRMMIQQKVKFDIGLDVIKIFKKSQQWIDILAHSFLSGRPWNCKDK